VLFHQERVVSLWEDVPLRSLWAFAVAVAVEAEAELGLLGLKEISVVVFVSWFFSGNV
jgi:hypothetical protein